MRSTLLAKQKRARGHVEFYLQESGEVRTTWNERYAKGGFSQVNSEMNQRLLQLLQEELSSLDYKSCLDLFGGDGNLTSWTPKDIKVDHIDIYPQGDHGNFYSHNLFDEGSLEDFSNKSR